MLKNCTECKRVFKGEGNLCTKCKEKTNKRSLDNCKECGVVTASLVEGFCKSCAKGKVDDFILAKNYLYDNPGATIPEVSKELDIPKGIIMGYVREGKLEIVNKDRENKCSCGKVIPPTSKKCLACKRDEEVLNKIRSNQDSNSKLGVQFHTNQ